MGSVRIVWAREGGSETPDEGQREGAVQKAGAGVEGCRGSAGEGAEAQGTHGTKRVAPTSWDCILSAELGLSWKEPPSAVVGTVGGNVIPVNPTGSHNGGFWKS